MKNVQVSGWRRLCTFVLMALVLGGAGIARAQPQADLTITKDGPAQSQPDAPISYLLTIGNNGPSGADGASFIDTLPPGMTEVTTICTGSSGGAVCPSLSTTNAQVSGALPTLPAGGQVVVRIDAKVPRLPSSSTLTNQAVVMAPQGVSETKPETNSTRINTALRLDADLSVTKTQTPASLPPSGFFGQPIRYTVTFTNHASIAVPGAFVQDQLQSSNAFSQGRPTGAFTRISCTQGPNTNACLDSVFTPSGSFDSVSSWTHVLFQGRLPFIGAGESVTVVYEVVWQAGSGCTREQNPDNIDNTAIIGTYPAPYVNPAYNDPDLGNNQARVSMMAPMAPPCVPVELEVTKSADPAPGSTFASSTSYAFTVTYENKSTLDLTGMSIDDVIGLGGYLAQSGGTYSVTALTCVSNDSSLVACPAMASASSGSLPPSGGSPLWSPAVIYDLPVTGAWKPGGKLTVTYQVTVTAATPSCGLEKDARFENNAGITGLVEPLYPDGTVSQRVVYPAAPIALCPAYDVSVTQTADSPRLRPGQSVVVTSTYTHTGEAVKDVGLSGSLTLAELALGAAGYQVQFLDCSANGAVCPPDAAFQSPAGTMAPNTTTHTELTLFDHAKAEFSKGGTVTVRYRLVLNDVKPRVCLRDSTPAVQSDTSAWRELSAQPPLIDSDIYNGSASLELDLVCTDVTVTKDVAPPQANPGDSVIYTIQLTNGGNGVAEKPTLSDALPQGFVFYGAAGAMTCDGAACSAPAWDAATRTVRMTPAMLQPGESVTLRLSGKAGAGGSYDNTAVVTASEYFEINTANDKSVVNLRVGNGGAPPVPVPALGAGALSGLGLLLAGLGAVSLRRRRGR